MQWLYQAVYIFFLSVVITSAACATEDRAKDIISEENLLIVELSVGQIPTEDNVEIYQHAGGFLVPLGFLAQLIDFSIEVNISNSQAMGWFISPNRNFILDPIKKTVVVEGKEKKLDDRIIIVGTDDIYVDSSLFSEWFPIDVELDFSHLLLKLKPKERLPFQLKEERKQRHDMLSSVDKKQNNYPKINTTPSNFTVPFVDVDLNNQYDTKSKPVDTSSFSILAQGDAAKLSTNLFISGDSKDNLTSTRVRAGNKDKDSGLLGPLHATEYALGDIDSIALPLVSSNSHGYGVFLSNFDLSRPDLFDETNFIGDSQPGWDIEIYRNGELIDFQTVGENGRYSFNKVPVLYGNNNFKIISYGPQGQVHEETHNYTIDDSISQKGSFNYRISADEKSQSIFGIDEQSTSIKHQKNGRFIGDMEYGLTDKVTLTTGMVSTPLEDMQTHNYQAFGIKSGILGTYSTINTAFDYTNNGIAGNIAINKNIKDISVRVERKQFKNFVSEEELPSDQQRLATSKIDFNGRISAIFPGGISYGLGGQAEEFTNNRDVITYTNRLATSLFGIGFSNNLQWQEIQTLDNQTSQGDGSFSMRGNYKQILLRLSLDYTIADLASAKAANLSLQREIGDKLNIRTDLKKDLSNTDLSSISVALNKEFKSYRLSTITSADTSDNYTLGVRLSFSFGRDTGNNSWFVKNHNIANSGAISAKAFLDKNYNGIYDADDTVIENVGFKSHNKKYASSEKSTSTLITGTTPDIPSDIELNLETLEDPYLTPRSGGYSVITRPGVITEVSFPVNYTTEIDGTIYHEKSGRIRPLSRAILHLVDKDGKIATTTKSEFDGFYVFSGVLPGEYNIVIAGETLNKLGATSSETHVTIAPNSEPISGIDITAVDVEEDKAL